MKILEYHGLDASRAKRKYLKIIEYLKRDDFRSADVKKFPEHGLYRAKIDDASRIIFKIMKYRGEDYALILEVVMNHAYDKSRFLRGARIDESKISPVDAHHLEKEPLPSLTYINPESNRFHLLDKIISFDPEQDRIYRHPLPMIIIGPAGSGKTALTLEKMKLMYGQVLYVTLSPYLVENSRNIYYAGHYENDEQEVSFLSFGEFIETMRVPEGREVTYRDFTNWLYRIPRQQRVPDAHQLYEEFRGVITGSVIDRAYLSYEGYINLGVRQSIYLDSERDVVYSLFERYLRFLEKNGCYDPNIVSYEYLKYAGQTYDFVVVDEVQDITNIQLKLILKTLKSPGNFILCGDSNQIVHPNFFSWGNLKSMFYNSESLSGRKITRILVANFRNSSAVTELSNRLLKIKQSRFGSIDRESNYLMDCLSEKGGDIVFLKNTDRVKRELNHKTGKSARFAVLVMRDEDKAKARQFFNTPLLFSIQEAKGLEYENVILLNFISGERGKFEEITKGVTEDDLNGDTLYSRARDKKDKSLEVFKFFVNSLYVAVTRAVERIYLIESDTEHNLLKCLCLYNPQDQIRIDAHQSTAEEWQAEAHRLDMQGKQEQADEIRRNVLNIKPVPWEVLTSNRIMALLEDIASKKAISKKTGKRLFEYALFDD
ncbi:MAG TPA: hypothetical protein ENG86_09855, partial [Nitrospirae bacterium]|nr:hypothetical protein [Nitrospirota bacterium]